MLKGLWIEDLDDNQARVIQHIKNTGAKMICVRTTASSLKALLPKFQQEMGLKVYGWRWPHLFPDPKSKPIDPNHPDPAKDDAAYWPNEMARVIDLVKSGIDGYPQTYWRFRTNAGAYQDEAAPIGDRKHPTGRPNNIRL
jgi:hypothetical protein